MKVGVLAMQGNYQQHQTKLAELNVESIQIRYSEELANCDALILPGGESTTMSNLFTANKLREPIKSFAKQKPVLGTCAGMIMLSSNSSTKNVTTLGIMNYSVERNGWGRQVNSFVDTIKLKGKKIKATFIRAPKITSIHKDLKVLASYNNEPVCVTDGKHIACSFHPEIGTSTDIHSILLENVK